MFSRDFRKLDPTRLSPEDARARGDLVMLHIRFTPRRRNRRDIPDVPGREHAEKVADFYDAYGQLPRYNVPEDISAYRTLKKLRVCASRPESAALLEALADIPGLLKEPGSCHEAALEALDRWCAETGRLPVQRSGDSAERRLHGAWERVRKNYERLGPDLQKKADLLSQAYKQQARSRRGGPAALPAGLYEAANLAEFHASHGRLPVFGVEGEERGYNHLRKLRNYKLKGTISQEALHAAEAVPGVFDFVRKDPQVQLVRLKAWCAEHGRLPRVGAAETDQSALEEMELGRWMYRHVHRRHDPVETAETQGTRDAILGLQEQYPSLSDQRRGLRARAVLDFVAASGRLPELGQESALYHDCFRIRQRWPRGLAPLKVISEMIAATEGLPDHQHSQWDGLLRGLESFVCEHGRLPSFGRKPQVTMQEKRFALWLETAREIGDPARVAKLDAVLESVARRGAAPCCLAATQECWA